VDIFLRGRQEGKLSRVNSGHSVHQIEPSHGTNKKETFEVGVIVKHIPENSEASRLERSSTKICAYSQFTHDLGAHALAYINAHGSISRIKGRVAFLEGTPSYYFL
jgi:hypothetical protein